MVRFGFRVPSLKKRLSARTSLKRYVRHSLGLKAPRGWGWPRTFTGKAVSAQDGETLHVLNDANQEHTIRLDGIDAPERKQVSARSPASALRRSRRGSVSRYRLASGTSTAAPSPASRSRASM